MDVPLALAPTNRFRAEPTETSQIKLVWPFCPAEEKRARVNSYFKAVHTSLAIEPHGKILTPTSHRTWPPAKREEDELTVADAAR